MQVQGKYQPPNLPLIAENASIMEQSNILAHSKFSKSGASVYQEHNNSNLNGYLNRSYA
jgi:hypothetical protein